MGVSAAVGFLIIPELGITLDQTVSDFTDAMLSEEQVIELSFLGRISQ
jgi:hypothetical protein